MKSIKFQVIYGDRCYEFRDGLKCYLFQTAVLNNFDKKYGNKAVLEYISKTFSCIYKDSNTTPIEDFAYFVIRHWQKVKNMESYELLDDFYKKNNF